MSRHSRKRAATGYSRTVPDRHLSVARGVLDCVRRKHGSAAAQLTSAVSAFLDRDERTCLAVAVLQALDEAEADVVMDYVARGEAA